MILHSADPIPQPLSTPATGRSPSGRTRAAPDNKTGKCWRSPSLVRSGSSVGSLSRHSTNVHVGDVAVAAVLDVRFNELPATEPFNGATVGVEVEVHILSSPRLGGVVVEVTPLDLCLVEDLEEEHMDVGEVLGRVPTVSRLTQIFRPSPFFRKAMLNLPVVPIPPPGEPVERAVGDGLSAGGACPVARPSGPWPLPDPDLAIWVGIFFSPPVMGSSPGSLDTNVAIESADLLHTIG